MSDTRPLQIPPPAQLHSVNLTACIKRELEPKWSKVVTSSGTTCPVKFRIWDMFDNLFTLRLVVLSQLPRPAEVGILANTFSFSRDRL